ncbi:MAG: hypothetical protein H8D34_11480, partial [Chloroflexi bacterium]|nr:hypothetical protein [Chloroflexota bacterium]
TISVVIWFLAPVVFALLISGGNPLVLLFAPVFGHFVGGQTAIFGMIGLWGYRKNINNPNGGLFLGLALLKPQLGLIPLAFAIAQWWRKYKDQRKISRQVWAWIITMIVIYLPGFLFVPDWPSQWLTYPRPLFERAMSGFVPRTLLYFVSSQTIVYWIILIIVGVLLLLSIWLSNQKEISIDLAVLWGFIVSPLVHDYDLIQLVPLLDEKKSLLLAVLVSIPGWFVILFEYGNNSAWYIFTIIAPSILCAFIYYKQKILNQSGLQQVSETG